MVPPLDRARVGVYRLLAPALGPWIRSRDVRVALHGLSVVGLSLLAAVLLPLPLMLVSPLLLGVPHLVADLRYLVARPGLHRRGGIAIVVGALLLLSGLTADLRWGLIGAAIAPLGARGSWGRRLVVASALLSVAVAAVVVARPAVLALVHAHNLIAVILWLLIASALQRGGPGGGLARIGPAGLAVAGGLAILSGGLDPLLCVGASLAVPPGPGLQQHAAELAPGVAAPWDLRLVSTFAYAQAVHYGVWLRVIPEDARRRPAPRSFRASLRALRDDLGGGVLVAALAAMIGLCGWATWDLVAARAGYLRLATFHGPMELAVLGCWLVEGPRILRP